MTKAEFLKMIAEWDEEDSICEYTITEFQEGALRMARWWAEQTRACRGVELFKLAQELLEEEK